MSTLSLTITGKRSHATAWRDSPRTGHFPCSAIRSRGELPRGKPAMRIAGLTLAVGALFGGALFGGALFGAACGGSGAPTLQAIEDQSAEVGVEVSIEIAASDPDGDALAFTVTAESIADLNDRAHPPTFVPFGANSAYLRWTPLAADVGTHTFAVTASDGEHRTSRSFEITVEAGNAVPVFREPLGSGTTLDLGESSCIEMEVVVDDPDSPDVDIYLEEPIEDGYEFVQDDPSAGIFSWCPTQKQVDGSERYTLNLAADDRAGHVGRKKYVIVLRRELGPSCPGEGPTIDHSAPGLQQTLQNIELTATVSDDLGLAGNPVLYYSLTAPADPSSPDFSQFVQLDMRRTAGDVTSGEYTAQVPNPVLDEAVGTVRTIHYFIEATDDDDSAGTCDHRTTAPQGGVYTVDVERIEGSGQGLGPCEACLADVQCDSGLCVALGSGPDANCLEPCTSPGAACGSGGTCSQSAWTTVDGANELVCLPAGSTCQATCVDDAYEDNDSIDHPNVPALGAGQYPDLQLCGDGTTGDDEDFYGILLSDTSLVTVTLLFAHDDGDVDLKLLDEQGVTVASSWSVTDNEQVSECLEPGLYFLRVYSYDWSINNRYDLVITIPPEGCCVDDSLEENDGALEALPALPGDLLEDLEICPDDQDWFALDAPADATVIVDVLFDQDSFDEDLDVYLYDRDGQTNLTPCCDSQNGQSGTSDEHLEHRVNAAGTYYVVVDGWNGASNTYWIGFDVQQ